MVWGAVAESDSLALSGSYQDVQDSAADMIVQLNPGEIAHVQFEYTPDQTSPTEHCEVHILSSPDGSNYDSVPYDSLTLSFTPDPNLGSTVVRGVRQFKIEAALVDTDGTAGGDDTGATLVVRVVKNGVNL